LIAGGLLASHAALAVLCLTCDTPNHCDRRAAIPTDVQIGGGPGEEKTFLLTTLRLNQEDFVGLIDSHKCQGAIQSEDHVPRLTGEFFRKKDFAQDLNICAKRNDRNARA